MPNDCRLVLLLLTLVLAPIAFGETGPDQTNRFRIYPQPLDSALLEFGSQSGYSIVFTAKLTAGKQSPGAFGNYRNRTALRRLLKGSGLTFRFLDGESVAVIPREDERVAASTRRPLAETRAGPDPADYIDDTAVVDEVVVVGSQMAGTNIADALPVTVWDSERLDALGAVDGGDLFRALPFAGAVAFNGIDTFFAGINSARGDVSSINIRDLGTGNTLVLLNGRRMVSHPGVQTEGRVPAMTANMNILPPNALSRVEILRDGASAVYGTDAVAGVINNVLRDDINGAEVRLGYGAASLPGFSEFDFGLSAGHRFNQGRSRVQVMASLTERSGVDASQWRRSRSSNLVPLLEGTAFAGDADFDNTSVSGPWGQFQLPVVVQQNGVPLTSESGIFHLQPTSFEGCITEINADTCIDDSFIDSALYGDVNSVRQLIPDLRRVTLIMTGSHGFDEQLEAFGELLFYDADSVRVTGASTTLSSTPITIPADNYWNPFGPVTFADGRANPNRLPGIDAPPEGLPISINGSFFGTAYRPVDVGTRTVDVENYSYRALAGLRGRRDDWRWDSAIMHTAAQTHDVARNRVSNSLFQRALAFDTPDAYNPFNGSGASTSGVFFDGNPNPSSVTNSFSVDVNRDNETSLTMFDFKVSNNDLVELPAGSLSLSAGIEVRRERFRETRDPRFNGTVMFIDSVTGERFDSDIMGTSVSIDSSGHRDVGSVFGEFAIPAFEDGQYAVPWRNLEVQIAARYEAYSDVGDSFQPRVSFRTEPVDSLILRGSWSRGIRAPNLPQLNHGITRRVLAATDWYRCRALVESGQIPTLGSCGTAGRAIVESSRTGSQDLGPEDYESASFGFVYSPAELEGFTATADFWRIEQDGIVGLFGAENQIAVDYALRLAGGRNDLVIRESPTQADIDLFAGTGLQPVGQIVQIQDSYINLDRRVSEGIDMSVNYSVDIRPEMTLDLSVDAARLLKAVQALSEPSRLINELDEPAIEVLRAGDLRNKDARPDWRIAAHAGVRGYSWQLAMSVNYVSDFYDTSAVSDTDGGFFNVDAWTTANLFAEKRLPLYGNRMSSLRVGVRNLFDSDPPIADETFGYNAAMHNSLGRYWYLRIETEL